MTQQEDVRMQMLAMERQIQDLKRQLGIRADRSNEPTKAPDGGAPSFYHMRAKATPIATIRVKLKKVAGNDEALIDPAHFDDRLHERLDPNVRVRRVLDRHDEPEAPPKSKKKEVITTNLTKAQLQVLSIGVLRTQPELVTGMDEKDIPDKKSEMVDAIMAVRDREAALVE